MTNTANKKAERIEDAFSELLDLIESIENKSALASVTEDLKCAECVESDDDWHANMAAAADKAPKASLKAKILKIKGMR
jgi:hypothetical protein